MDQANGLRFEKIFCGGSLRGKTGILKGIRGGEARRSI